MMTLGIVGAGQLGQMLGLAAIPLGIRCRFLDPSADPPAGVVGEVVRGEYDDYAALAEFVRGLDAITYEFENVPVETARWLNERVPVFPPPQALEVAQDRVVEKTFFFELGGVTVPPFAAVDTRADFEAALEQIRTPAVLKTRRFGYDGKGQARINSPADADAAWQLLGGRPLILEAWVPFEREVSLIAVRGRDRSNVFYPLIENRHAAGILRASRVPTADVSRELQQHAEAIATLALNALDYVGLLAIELFVLSSGQLIVNEMAPRVHNSGHWTQDGAATSQFENHVRAVAGLALGEPRPLACSAMWNVIGDPVDTAAVLTVPGAHLHLYGKSPRPNRKLGHINLTAATLDELERRWGQLMGVVGG